jgi:SPP1 family predicted phage head-tail adaptor
MKRTTGKIGRLRHRVEILSPTRTQDDYGEPILSWETWGTRWASVEPLTGRELWQAAQADAVVTHRIRMRAEGVKGVLMPDWRLKHDGREFEITAIRDVEERDWYLEIDCVEDVAAAESGSGGG